MGDGTILEKVGTPEWLATACHACAYSRTGTLHALVSSSSGLAVATYGRQKSTAELDGLNYGATDEELAQARAVALDGEFWFSLGQRLHGVTKRGGLITVKLDDRVLSLCVSPLGSSPRVVVTTSEGGRVIWCGPHLGEVESFARDLDHPLAGFTSDGYLIALSKEEGRVYQSQGRKIKARMTIKALDPNPLAVLPTDRSGEFAVATVEGAVKVYSLPRF